jgi:AcrR family transcriptional regulator
MENLAARRAALLDKIADHILAHGLGASSLRPLAKAAQTSDRMLLYYFADKSDLIASALTLIAERLTTRLAARTATAPQPLDTLRPALLDILLADDLWPYMRIWLEIASLAAKGDCFYRALGNQIARGFLAWGAAQLDSATPGTDAAKLLVAIEGTLLLKSVGLDDVAALANRCS